MLPAAIELSSKLATTAFKTHRFNLCVFGIPVAVALLISGSATLSKCHNTLLQDLRPRRMVIGVLDFSEMTVANQFPTLFIPEPVGD